MNKQQRKALSGHATTLNLIVSALSELKADDEGVFPRNLDEIAEELKVRAGELDDIRSAVEEMRDEEQEKYDNMPESLQGGSKGDDLQTAIDSLSEALDDIESSINDIESIDLHAEGAADDVNDTLDTAIERIENAASTIEGV